jgi:D-sedoheptulose 7-phosphate isomerase
MLETRLQQQFFESADLLYQAAESLTKPLASAAQMMLASVTAGSRLLVAGSGLAQADAQLVAALLTGHFEQDRPGLAALALQPQLGPLNAMPALARQIQALGHPGDLLLWLDPDGQTAAETLVAVARDQDMAVIALAGPEATALRAALSDTDLLISLPAARASRRLTTLRVALFALCDALDAQLLGLEP